MATPLPRPSHRRLYAGSWNPPGGKPACVLTQAGIPVLSLFSSQPPDPEESCQSAGRHAHRGHVPPTLRMFVTSDSSARQPMETDSAASGSQIRRSYLYYRALR